MWIDHIAERVDHDDGANESAVVHTRAGRAKPTFHHEAGAEELSDGSSGSCTYVALRYGFSGGLFTSAVSGGGIGANAGRAKTEVENSGCRHDRYFRNADVDANAVFFKIAHDTTSGIESKGAAAGQDNGVDLFYHV